MMIILNYLSCRHFAGLLSTYILFKFHFTPINNLPFLHNAHMHQTMVRSIYSFVDLCKYRIQIMVHGRLSSDYGSHEDEKFSFLGFFQFLVSRREMGDEKREIDFLQFLPNFD